MGDFFESLKNSISERLSSPLMGAYFISWCAFNYKFIVVLFSDMKPYVKFGFIGDHIYTGPLAYLYSFGAPVLATLVYLFILPFGNELVVRFNYYRANAMRQFRASKSGEALLSAEEVKQITDKYTDELKSRDAEVNDIERRMDRLRSREAEVNDLYVKANAENVEAKSQASLLVAKVDELEAKVRDQIKELNDVDSYRSDASFMARFLLLTNPRVIKELALFLNESEFEHLTKLLEKYRSPSDNHKLRQWLQSSPTVQTLAERPKPSGS
ncbi:MAG: hypothetical protein GAK45_00118 [Pseudomonas citronellolis]|nr:MAG: hypothetical protein GAK45_00118 [Pseudomonas citronellolis]